MDDYNITSGREGGCAQMIGGSIYTHTGGEAYQKMMASSYLWELRHYYAVKTFILSAPPKYRAIIQQYSISLYDRFKTCPITDQKTKCFVVSLCCNACIAMLYAICILCCAMITTALILFPYSSFIKIAIF